MKSTIQWLNHHAVHRTILYVSTFWKTRARLTSMELVQSSSNLNMCQAVLASVVQRLDSAIHRINLYPVDSAISFPNTYPLDSDLSSG